MARLAKHFALMAAVLFVMVAFARKWPRNALDLQIHDIYFVIPPTLVLLMMGLFASLFSVGYSLKPMNRRLAGAHFWIRAVGLLGFWISFYVMSALINLSMAAHSANTTGLLAAMTLFSVSAVLVLISPLLFVFNLIAAIAKPSWGTL